MTDLPGGWSSAPLGDVCTIVGGGTPKTGTAEYWGGDVPWITPADMSADRSQVLSGGARTLTAAGLIASAARVVPAGSVVVSSRAPIGYVAIAGTELATNQGCKTAVPPEFIDSRYLYWYLLAARPDLEARASGTTFKEISAKEFGRTLLRWPSLDEQRRIVEILEDHLSRLDAANNYLNAAAGRLDALRLSALQDMSRALRHDGAPVRRIADVADSSLGKMLDAKRAAGSPTPYLRNINVRWGHFDLEDVSTVPLTDDERSRLALHEGDVLVCEGGEPGRCAIWHQERAPMAFQKALHRIRVKPGLITPEFLALSLESFIRSGSADRLFTGTTIKHLPQEKLREIAFPVPSLESQAAAVARLTALEESRSEALRQSWRMTERATTLRRTLLTAAFSGRLTGRSSDLDLAEEMARA